MNYFLKANKNLLTYSLITIIIIPLLGIKFLFGLLGNILMLLFLIPIFILLVIFLVFNSYKSKINICNNCGTISLDLNKNCMNCGANLENNMDRDEFNQKPSESTIEVKAEEIN